ncbi:MAG: UvrD-helicase domain-containing protein [Pseudomonadota bacterium]
MSVSDQTARDRAIHTNGSYCVTAPAGSGKTSLLVQRYLALLPRVQSPESICAITFTRKAAAEMRQRVLDSFTQAQQSRQAASSYEQRTIDLAALALDHAREQQWNLLESPACLRIQTIDSLCAEIARQMPLTSGTGGAAEVSDRQAALQRTAVLNLLKRELDHSDKDRSSDVRRLLLHLDNNWEQALALMGRLLDQREQWQPLLLNAAHADGPNLLQKSLQRLASNQVLRIRQVFDAELSELRALYQHRCEKLSLVADWNPDSEGLANWQDLASMLLTKDRKGWRKTVTKAQGFPVDSPEDRSLKQDMLNLLKRFREEPDENRLVIAQHLLELPLDESVEQESSVLAAVLRLLPRLAAEMLIEFKSSGQNDYTQVALAALQALGTDDSPTDLAMRLDYRLEHLLVDEFQDTSSLQFELLRRLIRGWAEHNQQYPEGPRTLFLVGDAQQSIYGFRQANVSLFLQARDHGIGDFPLQRLDLGVNFRSAPQLVTWVNDQFSAALPPQDDPQLGAVAHLAAEAAQESSGSVEVELLYCENDDDSAAGAELTLLCDKVEEGMKDPAVSSIAVLGRSRTVLRPIVRALVDRGLAPVAHDLDALAGKQVIRDLLTLCCVLTDRSDRYAWLSLLRTPPIGLDYDDLLQVSLAAPTPQALSALPVSIDVTLGRVSAVGRERVAHALSVLHWADSFRDRLALKVWVEECWLRLGGPASVNKLRDLLDAEQLFSLLPGFEDRREPLSRIALERELATLYAAAAADSKLQVMTLHKSKGLEFDWVFLPSLHAGAPPAQRDLLLWDGGAVSGSHEDFLFDLRPEVDDPSVSSVYSYLRWTEKQKRRYEDARLLYVGCTRAEKKLCLSGVLKWDASTEKTQAPKRDSLLRLLWPTLSDHPQRACSSGIDSDVLPSTIPVYQRLRETPEVEAVAKLHPAQHHPVATNINARAYGTAVHRCMECLAYRSELPTEVDSGLLEILHASLWDAGAPANDLESLTDRATQAVARTLNDPWARWALSPEQLERQAELELAFLDGENPISLIVDYTFIDAQSSEPWVIDYKTTKPSPEQSMGEFFEAQEQQYKSQLANYRRALAELHGATPRCALYFPELAMHHELLFD